MSKVQIQKANLEVLRHKKTTTFRGDPKGYENAMKYTQEITKVEILDEEKHKLASAKLKELIDQWATKDVTIGEAFIQDSDGADALSKLSRYETTIERGLYKALHELQRLQAARAGKETPLPIAVDIDLSGKL